MKHKRKKAFRVKVGKGIMYHLNAMETNPQFIYIPEHLTLKDVEDAINDKHLSLKDIEEAARKIQPAENSMAFIANKKVLGDFNRGIKKAMEEK